MHVLPKSVCRASREALRRSVVVLSAAALIAATLAFSPVTGTATANASQGPAQAIVPSDVTLGIACSPNDLNDDISTRAACIAGTTWTTRQAYVNPDCVAGPNAGRRLDPSYMYVPRECGGGYGKNVEFIAQSRYIYLMNIKNARRSGSGITSDIQWEMNIPGPGTNGRADIVEYDAAQNGGTVGITEMKTSWNGGFAAALDQDNRYITNFNADSRDANWTAVPGDAHIKADYSDTFTMDLGACSQDPSYHRTETFAVNQEERNTPGALIISLIDTKTCRDGGVDDHQITSQDQVPQDEDYEGLPDFILPLLESPQLGSPAGPTLPTQSSPSDFWSNLINGLGIAACQMLCIKPGEILLPIAMVDGTTAMVSYDSLPSDLLASIKKASTSVAYGDVHLRNLDGTAFDVQSVGEFDLVQSARDDMPYDFRVQARFRGLPGGNVSVIDSIAFMLNGKKVMLSTSGVVVDGASTSLPDNSYLYFGDGAVVIRQGGSYAIIWPGRTDRPILTFDGGSISLHIPQGMQTRGLLGNNDGVKGNDFVTRSGWDLGPTPTTAALHGSFADSWRITDASSLFSYASGQSTATFTDTSYPQSVVKISDYSTDSITAAQNSCDQAGVKEGPALTGCISDVLLSGDAPTFTAIAAGVNDPSGELVGAQPFDVNGNLVEDFEGAIPPNFDPYQLSTDASTTTFAGPLAGDRPYAFTVGDMPNHNQLSAGFDLLTLGSWDGVNATATLTIDGINLWSSSLSNVTDATLIGSGQLASGDSYKKYHVEVSVPHSASSLKASLTTTGLTQTSNRAIGIDNIQLNEQLVPPQSFALPLDGSAVSNGVPAAGAGNLETKASEDDYTFTVPDGGKTLFMDWRSCLSSVPAYTPNGLNWQIVNAATGAKVAADSCRNGNKAVALPAGDYRLQLTSDIAYNSYGTYSLAAYFSPDPQSFALPLDGSAVSNGVPAAGAGNLETKASEDDYTFTVPAGGKTFNITWVTCLSNVPAYTPNGLNWQIVNAATGAKVAADSCRNGNKAVALPAGDYRLQLTSDIAYNSYGTYSLTGGFSG